MTDGFQVHRIDPETGEPKELPLVTVFTAPQVWEVLNNLFMGKRFETDGGLLREQVKQDSFAADDELVTMTGADGSVLDMFVVKRKGK